MYPIRVFFIGGLTSFRALFAWLSPWIYIPSLLIAPLFQILLFTSIGRAAHTGTDMFYLVGNAIQYVAAPCMFAMAQTVAGERLTNTLSVVLASPARRLPLFLGRAMPVLLNGCLVSIVSLVVGSLILRVQLPLTAWPRIILVILVASASCTGLGLIIAASALRVRETAVASNLVFGVLLIFCGANVPLASLPGWVSAIGQWLPLTHAIEAARMVASGKALGDVASLLLDEAGLGALYFAIGLLALWQLEQRSRRSATLDLS